MIAAVSALPRTPAIEHICALLRGEARQWPSAAEVADNAAFLRAALHHGAMPLLNARFAASIAKGTSPEAIRQACHEDAIAHAMRELAQRAELTRALAALAGAGIDSLLLKGSGLAYSHYPSPALRPRADFDLLVARTERTAAAIALRELGYRRVSGPAGPGVGFQVELHRDDPHGITHNVDLHWRISNAQSFAWLFSFAELAAASVPVTALGPHARRLGDVHALIIALLHRALNNQSHAPDFGDRLIWLYDVHLLVEAMTDDDLRGFRQVVERARVVAIAIEGLRRCAECFGSPRVAALAEVLEYSPAAASGAAFLRAGKLRREWLELCAVPTTAARARYVASRMFPSREYLRERFPDAADRALPVLHVRRWREGLGARMAARGH